MGKKITKELSHDEFYARLKKQQLRQQRKATIISAAILVVFLALVFFVLPPNLPWGMQKLVGVLNALLVMLLAIFGVKEFGEKYRTFNLPLLKKIDTGIVVGCALGLLVLGWWMSPFAPIVAGTHGAEEVAVLLGDEITLAVLVMPDTMLAVIEPPVPPSRAAAISERIAADADIHSRLIKAIAERRYIEAEVLAKRAQDAGVDAGLVALARGQLAVYSGQYEDAPRLFDVAVAEGGDGIVIAQQAVAYALAGNLFRAYEIASALVDSARSGSVKGDNTLGISLNLKAALALSSGRFKEAIALTEQSQSAWEDVDDSPHKAASRNNQAVVYAMLPKKYSGAETQFDGAMTLWGELYGFDSAHVAGSRHNLGVLAISQARYVEAERRLNHGLELARQNYPPDSAGIFPSVNVLSRLHTMLGRYSTAQKFADEAARSIDQSPQLKMANLAALGTLLTGQGSYRDASGSFGNAINLGVDFAVPEFVYLAEVTFERAAVNSIQGRHAQTVGDCQAAIKTFEDQLGKNHPLVARACNTVGWEYVRSGKKAEAREQFDRAQAIFAANKNEIGAPPALGNTLAGLAQLYTRRQRASALQDLREAIKIEAEALGPVLGASANAPMVETPQTADYLFDQAMLYLSGGSSSDYENAQGLFEQVVSMREKLLPRTHPALAVTYENFATLLKKMGKEREAEAMHEKAEAARQRAAKHA